MAIEPKLGVFICTCNGSLQQKCGTDELLSYVRQLPDVVCAEAFPALCSRADQDSMVRKIEQAGPSAVVVAGCSPAEREEELKGLVSTLGLADSLFVANIRTLGRTPAKAKVQVMRAIGKARLCLPLPSRAAEVVRSVAVIGGGISGLKAALGVARSGMEVTLIEKEPRLGGKLINMVPLGAWPDIAGLEKEVRSQVNVITSARIKGIVGQPGNFVIRVANDEGEREVRAGAVIVAVGGAEKFTSPLGLKLAPEITTLSSLEGKLARGEGRYSTVGFLLDVSQNNSRLNTLQALRQSLLAKQRWGAEVYVFCRTLKIDSPEAEALYRRAREAGVIFFKFQEEPFVQPGNGEVLVELNDALLGLETVRVVVELLVVDEKRMPSLDLGTLANMLGVGTDSEGFAQEANVYLYPVKSNRAGVYFAGSCRAELTIAESIFDAETAAAECIAFLGQAERAERRSKVLVDELKCTYCLTCLRSCPHKAISINPEKRVPQFSDIACQLCGICAAECPGKALQLSGYTDAQIVAELGIWEESL